MACKKLMEREKAVCEMQIRRNIICEDFIFASNNDFYNKDDEKIINDEFSDEEQLYRYSSKIPSQRKYKLRMYHNEKKMI